MTGEPEKSQPAAIRFGVRTYQHVAAIIGGFALAAFLGNFVDVDWRGLFAAMIGVWDEYVRPPVRWLLHYLIEVPLGWVGWRVAIPRWLHDYLAAGIVLFASYIRVVMVEFGWRHVRSNTGSGESFPRARDTTLKHMVRGFLPSVLLWPAQFVAAVVMAVREASAKQWREAGICIMVCSPAIYGAVLLAANYLLPR